MKKSSQARVVAAARAAVAVACFGGALAPTEAQTGDKAAAVRHYLAGADAAGAGRPDAAVREYLAGEAADPAYAINYFALADLFVQNRDYAAAQVQLQRLLALSPRTPYAHYYLALVLEAQHQNGLALKNLDAELQINPTYAPARRARGEVLAVLGAAPSAAFSPSASPAARSTPRSSPKASPRPTPAPTPKPTFSNLPVPSPKPSFTKVSVPAPKPSFSNFPVPTPKPTVTNVPAPAPKPSSRNFPVPTPRPAATAFTAPPPSPTALVLTSALLADAKGYLLEVARDVAFTQALPPPGPPQDLQSVERTVADNQGRRGSYDLLLSSGIAALSAGHEQLAHQAFESAAEKRPSDWRAPYLEGLASEADGDLHAARALFFTALQRAKRPEILTSLAIVDVRLDDLVRAATEAQSAAELDAAYQPAQVTAGLIALASGDASTAAHRLQSAVALGHAPERTPYFLDAAQRAIAVH